MAAQRTVAAHSNDTKDEQTLISMEERLCEAFLHGNAGSLGKIYHSDLVQTNVRAEVSNKTEEITELRDKAIRYDKFESFDLKVHLYGDAAVVTGRSEIEGIVMASGRVIHASVRFTDTFIRQNGQWQIVAIQTTAIPTPPQTETSPPK
jgi:ketosteroid isomerase-like protein